jgi:hypothetical protein
MGGTKYSTVHDLVTKRLRFSHFFSPNKDCFTTMATEQCHHQRQRLQEEEQRSRLQSALESLVRINLEHGRETGLLAKKVRIMIELEIETIVREYPQVLSMKDEDNVNDYTPLLFACRHDLSPELISLFVRLGPDDPRTNENLLYNNVGMMQMTLCYCDDLDIISFERLIRSF